MPSSSFAIWTISFGTSIFGFSFLGLDGSSISFLFFKASNISLQFKSSTSFPLGALVTYFIVATCCSSFRIRSPPLSPSRKAVDSFSLEILFIVSGILAPSTAMMLYIPHRIRLIISALPSTRMISLALLTSGPAESFSGPYFSTFATFNVSATSLKISSTEGRDSIVHLCRISLALPIIAFLRACLTSSIFSRVTFAAQGPTLFMLSILAAVSEVETLSMLVGIVIVPVVLSCLDCNCISILPILPDF